MEDLAEQVQAVLSDPDQMARVMELAGRLGFGPEPGSQDAVTGSEQPPAGQAGPSPAPPPGGRTGAVLRSLGPLLSAQKQMNAKGGMKIVGVNDTIMEIFEVTGFSDILTIE